MINLIKKKRFKDLELSKRCQDERIPCGFELELTVRCNNNCTHCYNSRPVGDKLIKYKEMSFEKLADIIDQAVDLGALACRLTGGEPLLRDDFIDIYMYLKKKGLLITLFTNGTLLSEKYVNLMKKYPPRGIEISIYGVHGDTYERISRNKGSFSALELAIGRLKSKNIPFRTKTMVMRSNYKEYDELENWCRDLTCDYFRFDPYLHLRCDRDPIRNRKIMSERLEKEIVVRLDERYPERLRFISESCKSKNRQIQEYIESAPLFLCGTGNDSFAVSYDGYFRLCPSLVHPDCIYDLNIGSLHDAWNYFVPKVRSFVSRKKEYLSNCYICSIKNICFLCPATSYLETGELDGTCQYFCQVAHARAKIVGERSNVKGFIL